MTDLAYDFKDIASRMKGEAKPKVMPRLPAPSWSIAPICPRCKGAGANLIAGGTCDLCNGSGISP